MADKKQCASPAVLTELLVSAVVEMSGQYRAANMAQATGLTEQALRRRPALPKRQSYLKKALEHLRRYETQILSRSGVPDAAEIVGAAPAQPIERFVYWTLFHDSARSRAASELARTFDCIEEKLCQQRDRGDLAGAWYSVVEGFGLPKAYRAPLAASGMPRFPMNELAPDWSNVAERWVHLMGHATLSLMAALDHATTFRLFRESSDMSLFRLLLAPPYAAGRARTPPASPVTRLLDFITALAERSQNGQWPPRRPGPQYVAMRWREPEAAEPMADIERRIGNLRCGHTRLTTSEFRRYARAQLGNADNREDLIQALIPMLLAAHVFSGSCRKWPSGQHHESPAPARTTTALGGATLMTNGGSFTAESATS